MTAPLIRAAAALAVAAFALTACSATGGDSEGDIFTSTDTIRATVDIPATFNPQVGASLPDFVLARASFDTLLRKDDSGLVPGLAESWETTPNTGVFTIRDGATCSDGTPITATIVKDSLDAFAASPGTIVPQTFGEQMPEITADDGSRTVTISLEQPWAYLDQALAASPTGIVCPAGLADPEALGKGHVEGAESGPYVLTKAEPGVKYTYELREDYDQWPEWTTDIAGEPSQKVEYTISPDTSATTNLILDGQLDIGKIEYESIPRFEGKEGYATPNFLFSDMYFIFNEREGSPFADLSVRKAVAQAVDSTAFNTIISDNLGEVATNLASSATPCVADHTSPLIAYDPAAAAEVLEGVTIRLVSPLVVGTNGAGNTFIQEQLRAAGAEVELQNVDVGTWINTVYTQPGDWDLTVFADLNSLGSLASPIGVFYGPGILEGGGNIGGISETDYKKVEELQHAARAEADEDARCAMLTEATDEIISQAHGTPLVTSSYIWATRPGYEIHMLGGSLDDQIFRITGDN